MQWILRRWNVYAIGCNATEPSAFLPLQRQRLYPSPRYLSGCVARLSKASDGLPPSAPSPPSLTSAKRATRKLRSSLKNAGAGANTRSLAERPEDEASEHEREQWQIQKAALKEKFGDEAWKPHKRLSPDTIEGIRAMHASDPNRFTTPVLAENFKVSPEAIRRILKSKWQPTAEQQEKRRERWERRGERVWSSLAEVGVKPPKPWRVRGVGRAEPGDIPVWKGRGRRGRRGRGSASTTSGPGDATTIRRGLVAEKPGATACTASTGSVGKSILNRIL